MTSTRELHESAERSRRDTHLTKYHPHSTYGEQSCDSILDVLATPIVFKNVQGQFTGCNNAFAAFLGYDKSEIIGMVCSDFVPPKDAQAYEAMDRRLLR